VKVAPTTGPGAASALAREHIQRGVDLVVAAGGDGTVNEIVEGMVHSEVPLAILPGGTANVLAMEMTLGKNLERVAERLGELRPHRISVGHVTCDGGRIARHFLLMAGIGVDAHIVYHVSGSLKARIGKLAYWVAGCRVLGRRLASLQVEIGGQAHPCSFALVGMALNRLNGMKGVTVLRADRMTVSGPEDSRVYVQIDGESAGHLPAEIRIVPNALTLLVPPEYEGRLVERRDLRHEVRRDVRP
jgi:diacylglycerol kinase (ATP)